MNEAHLEVGAVIACRGDCDWIPGLSQGLDAWTPLMVTSLLTGQHPITIDYMYSS
jgi:hypothetical protein